MKKIIWFLIVLFLISQASATQVLREVNPKDPVTEEIIEVRINIFNDQSSTLSYEVEEKIIGDMQLIDPPKPYEIRQFDGIVTPILKWNIQALPNKITTISYKVKSSKPGQFTFAPIKLTETSTRNIVIGESNEITIQCVPNGECNQGENYLNCRLDCTTGAQDGICNPIQDGICDVDCTSDVDCGITQKDYTTLYYIIAGIILALIIFIVVIKLIKSRDNDYTPNTQQQTPAQKEQDPLAGIQEQQHNQDNTKS